MIRISLPYFFQIANALEPLRMIPAGPYKNVEMILFAAQWQLEGLLYNSVFSASVRSSRNLGETLLNTLRGTTSDENADRDSVLAAQLGRRHASLMLLQNPDDLLLREP